MILSCAGLFGCAGSPPPGLPEAPRLDAALPAPPYRVQVGDVLVVRVYLSPEFDENVTVRPDGRISTLLAARVTASGRTTEEVAAALYPTYDAELREPRLAVEVKTAMPQRVYVAGEVPSPGEFSVAGGPGLTLVQAVARAGGLRVSGDASHVFILRRGPGDTPVVLTADFGAIVRGEGPADIRLAPFDVVYVPRTGINRVYVWFNQHFQQFVPVSWGFSYNVNPLVSGARN